MLIDIPYEPDQPYVMPTVKQNKGKARNRSVYMGIRFNGPPDAVEQHSKNIVLEIQRAVGLAMSGTGVGISVSAPKSAPRNGAMIIKIGGKQHVIAFENLPSAPEQIEQDAAVMELDRQSKYVDALKTSRGGAWSTNQAEEKLQITRQSLKERRDSFSIVYWTDPKGHCFYPKWQFTPGRQVKPEVREILGDLRTHDTLHVLTRFLVPFIGTPKKSAIDLIDAKRGAEAVQYVRDLQDER